jgi:protein TonB
MFTENLLESGGGRRANRGWATTASFSFQLAIVAVLVVLPTIYPSMMAIQVARPITVPLFTPAPQVVTENAPRQSGASTNRNQRTIIAVSPTSLTFGNKRREMASMDPAGPPSINLAGIGTDSGAYIPDARTAPPDVTLAPPTRAVVTSRLAEGNLLQRVQPTYPQIAKTAHAEGRVILTAIISKSGTIESLHVSSGHLLLIPAAIDAVRQWRYRPYILNGEPIEVETQITVNFKLSN